MAVTPQQRRAALIALIMTASAGGGYVAKDELLSIGQQFCGPVPHAMIEKLDGTRLPATPENIERVNRAGAQGVKITLDLGKAQGLLAAWCDPDKQQLNDDITMKMTKGTQ